MSSAEHEKPEGKGKAEPPRAGSSLTDAVVAALAKVDGEGADGEQPAGAEAGCAATQEGGGKAPPPAVVGGAPADGVNGANGFRSGPGSFADLMRRWSGAAPAAAPPAAEPGAKPEPGPAPEPPEARGEPKPAPEPAVVDSGAAPAGESADGAEQAAAAGQSALETAPGGVRVRYYGRTDVGLVREHNEDNFLVADLGEGTRDGDAPREATVRERGCIFAVCDGMGGAAAGEVASQMAVDTIYEVLGSGEPAADRDDFARRLVRSIEEAGHRIFSAAKMDRTRRGMGTTATLAGLMDDVLFVGQVGDSRAYVLRGDQLEMITKDQSLVNQLIEAGQLTEEEAEAFEHSNIILQALGTTEEVTVDLTFLQLRQGDRLMICSDGLSGLVHADMIKEVMQETAELTAAADKLIQMANAGGGHDNVTVILADFDGEGLQPADDAKVVYQQYPLPPDDRTRGQSVPPRETSIKEGGPKPGADVKREDYAAGPTQDVAVPQQGGSKAWLFGLLVVGVLAVLAGGYLVMSGGLGGEGAETSGAPEPPPPPPEPTTPPETAPLEEPVEGGEAPAEAGEAGAAGEAGEATEAAEAEARATITVSTDVEEGTLFVNDEARGPVSDGMTLDLGAGAYDFEVRQGEAIVAEAESVSVAAGDAVTVDLSRPTGEVEAPAREPAPAEPAAESPPRETRRPRPGGAGGAAGRRGGRGGRGGSTSPSGLPSNPF
jgi:protein phosphatase